MHECSFCGKTTKEVNAIIQGPNVTICNECVERCQNIITIKRMEHIQDLITRNAFKEFFGTDA